MAAGALPILIRKRQGALPPTIIRQRNAAMVRDRAGNHVQARPI